MGFKSQVDLAAFAAAACFTTTRAVEMGTAPMSCGPQVHLSLMQRQAKLQDGSQKRRKEARAAAGESANTMVWVAGWGRSGSSIIFDMVLAGARTPSGSMPHFGLFEPCDVTDSVDPELQGDCARMMSQLFRCDFKGINSLFGWRRDGGGWQTDISGINAVETAYSPELARQKCSDSELLVYKTVADFGKDVGNILSILDAQENVFAIVSVRDPRGIYASRKTLSWGEAGTAQLQAICESARANLHKNHPRLRRVIFEQLATEPERVMKQIYSFLGLDFGPPQQDWINETFNSDCAMTGTFKSCHTNSTEPVHRWRKDLTAEEVRFFRESAACREVAVAYEFEP